MLATLPKAFSSLTGITIAKSEFFIQSIESGSLLEDICVKFFFGSKEELDAFVEKLGKNKVLKGAVIAGVVAAVVAYGAVQATAPAAAPHITATNSIIIQGGAGALSISESAFQAAIAAAASDKKAVAESALKLLTPARKQSGSAVSFSDVHAATPSATFPAQAVAETPEKLVLEANERVEEYENTRLVIRATNLDSKKNGWAGKLALREERLPIELDPAVSESEIFGRQEVMVDAALVFKEKGRSHELKPARIYVRKVHSPE